MHLVVWMCVLVYIWWFECVRSDLHLFVCQFIGGLHSSVQVECISEKTVRWFCNGEVIVDDRLENPSYSVCSWLDCQWFALVKSSGIWRWNDIWWKTYLRCLVKNLGYWDAYFSTPRCIYGRLPLLMPLHNLFEEKQSRHCLLKVDAALKIP